MIRHLLYLALARVASWRCKYWHKVTAGQRRAWGRPYPDHSARLTSAMLARSHWQAKAMETWE